MSQIAQKLIACCRGFFGRKETIVILSQVCLYLIGILANTFVSSIGI